MKEKYSVNIEIINRNKLLNYANENTKKSIIDSARAILEDLFIYETDPLTFIFYK